MSRYDFSPSLGLGPMPTLNDICQRQGWRARKQAITIAAEVFIACLERTSGDRMEVENTRLAIKNIVRLLIERNNEQQQRIIREHEESKK